MAICPVDLPTGKSESSPVHTVTLYSECDLFLLWFPCVSNGSIIHLWLKAGINTVFSLFTCYIQLSMTSTQWYHSNTFKIQLLFSIAMASTLSKRLSFLIWTTVKFFNTGYSSSSFDPQSILYTPARTVFSNHILDGITQLLKGYSFSLLLDKAQPSFTCFTVLLSAYPPGHNPYLFYNIISFHLMSQP